MSMLAAYGNYTFPTNCVAITIDVQPLVSPSGVRYGSEETWHMSGKLSAPSIAQLTLMCNAMELAFSVNNRNLLWVYDTGVIARKLAGVTTLGGTRVVSGVQFPESGARTAERANYITFSVAVKGSYAVLPTNPILSWRESVQYTGDGGPQVVVRENRNSVPQPQLVTEVTSVRATQSGSASMLLTYPPFPPALSLGIPLSKEISQKYDTPRRMGGLGVPTYLEYPITWTYPFISPTPVFSYPTLQPSA